MCDMIENTRERREQVSNGLERMAPSETERLVIHALYMEQKKAQQAATNAGGAPCVYMKDTTMSSTRLCQPQVSLFFSFFPSLTVFFLLFFLGS